MPLGAGPAARRRPELSPPPYLCDEKWMGCHHVSFGVARAAVGEAVGGVSVCGMNAVVTGTMRPLVRQMCRLTLCFGLVHFIHGCERQQRAWLVCVIHDVFIAAGAVLWPGVSCLLVVAACLWLGLCLCHCGGFLMPGAAVVRALGFGDLAVPAAGRRHFEQNKASNACCTQGGPPPHPPPSQCQVAACPAAFVENANGELRPRGAAAAAPRVVGVRSGRACARQQ